jgi:hypothetical protein
MAGLTASKILAGGAAIPFLAQAEMQAELCWFQGFEGIRIALVPSRPVNRCVGAARQGCLELAETVTLRLDFPYRTD